MDSDLFCTVVDTDLTLVTDTVYTGDDCDIDDEDDLTSGTMTFVEESNETQLTGGHRQHHHTRDVRALSSESMTGAEELEEEEEQIDCVKIEPQDVGDECLTDEVTYATLNTGKLRYIIFEGLNFCESRFGWIFNLSVKL